MGSLNNIQIAAYSSVCMHNMHLCYHDVLMSTKFQQQKALSKCACFDCVDVCSVDGSVYYINEF